jgi:predicted glycoside hydrolase/deacetylase ChbG (UPF0249 family)
MRRVLLIALVLIMLCATTPLALGETWAQKLGWGPQDRVLMIHADDVGMCRETVLGATDAYEHGVVSCMSIMMDAPWVGLIAEYIKQHPDTDAGLHLALNSEWDYYRFGPVAGKSAVPSLTDQWGCLWDNVDQVKKNATADEVEIEIRAQIARALAFGIKPTHIDTHMGALYCRPDIAMRYIKVGIEMGIPVMAIDLPEEQLKEEAPDLGDMFKQMIQTVWNSGLPVIDGLVPADYGMAPEKKKADYIRLLRELPPGVNELIVHCAKDSDNFRAITGAAPRWIEDGKLMLDPEIRQVIKDEGIILTGWRELKARRDKVGKTAQ